MDFAAAGLLDGLEGEERAAREQLLARLASEGVSLEDLRAAVAEDRLALLPLERVLGGRYTGREVEQRTGLPMAFMTRLPRLLGLSEPGPDDRVFGDADIAAAHSTKLFLVESPRRTTSASSRGASLISPPRSQPPRCA